MRRVLAAFTLWWALLCPISLSVAAQQGNAARQDQKAQTVYITRAGKKYHRDGCRYFASSKIPISLNDAKVKGYTACKVCPPAGVAWSTGTRDRVMVRRSCNQKGFV
jgi:hypothetical protein